MLREQQATRFMLKLRGKSEDCAVVKIRNKKHFPDERSAHRAKIPPHLNVLER